jgi:membrane-bound metal-dependent hydrolase YbcI (DUF457 family)
MTYTSHVVTAVATASALIAFQVIALPQFPEYGTNEEISLFLAMGIVAMGGLVPDIDHAKSFISNKFHFSLPFKHRGFTHQIWLWSAVMFAASQDLISHPNFWWWLSIGALLHSFGDMHTHGGVKLFGFEKKGWNVLPKFLVFKTGGFIEYFALAGYTALGVLSLFKILSSF